MIQVQGLRELQAALAALPLEFNHKALQAAHAEAAIPLVNEAHLLAPVGKTGNLADSIGVEKPSLKRVNEIGQVNVGPRRGRYKGNHAHLVEYGTGDRGRTGVMPAHPFMKPAFEKEKDDVFKNINEILGRKVVSAMKRKIKSTGGVFI